MEEKPCFSEGSTCPCPPRKGQHLSGLAVPVAHLLLFPLLYPHASLLSPQLQLRVSSPKKLTLPATPFSQDGREWLVGHRQDASGQRSSDTDLGPRPSGWQSSAELAQGRHDLVSHVWGPGQSI